MSIPYSRKYWRSLSLVVWPQTKRKKILAEFKFGGGIVLRHHKHCACIYQGALPSSCLRYLNNAVSSQIYKKYNWQHASVELGICTARVEGHRAGQRALLHAYIICVVGENNIGGF